MLDFIAPFGIATTIRGLSLQAPGLWGWLAFAVMFVVYWNVLVFVATAILLRVDVLVATAIRRLGGTPPSVQFWLGDTLERARPWSRRAGIWFVLVTAAFVSAPLFGPLSANSVVRSLRDFWLGVLQFVW